MSRMTELLGTRYFAKKDYTYDILEDKLGQLEDIEDELGIDLITLFKALKNGAYVKHPLGQIYKSKCYLYDKQLNTAFGNISLCLLVGNIMLEFKDYGETWALTKEELE